MHWLLSLVLALLTLSTVSADSPQSNCAERHCAAVFDAGSTGTRLHIYVYDLNEYNEPVHLEEILFKKESPGLSKISLEGQMLEQYLDHFKEALGNHIPIYFYATAGMRLLSEEDQQSYFDRIRQWFHTQAPSASVDARIISGFEEGVFGWLAVNYHQGGLDGRAPVSGVMDTGGASIQVAVPIEETQDTPSLEVAQFDLYQRHFQVFVHSFLGLGVNEVTKRLENEPSCFPTEYVLPNQTKGQGDAATCAAVSFEKLNEIFHITETTHNAFKANIASSWYVLGAIGAMIKDPPMQFQSGTFTIQELLSKAHSEVCAVDWEVLKNQYAQKNPYIGLDCLIASYYSGIVEQGYQLPPSTIIQALPKADSVDWTLGVVLHPSIRFSNEF